MFRNPPIPQGQQSEENIRVVAQDATIISHKGLNAAHGSFEERADAEWLERNILSLDGGGVRGYWSLLALEKLMEYIAEREDELDATIYHSFSPEPWPENVSQIPLTNEENARNRQIYNAEAATRRLPSPRRFLPCHYFDHICGSSTGALIAIMLGRFRMTVPDCKLEYKNLGQQVFGKPRIFCTLRFPVGNRFKYKATRLEVAFKDVASRRDEMIDRAGKITFPSGRGLCATFVTTRKSTADTLSDMLYLIRSYDHSKRNTPDNSPGPTRASTNLSSLSNRQRRTPTGLIDVNYEKAQDFEVWQVARAATAAPLYFEPFKMETARTNECIEFTDGGFGSENNPAREAKQDIEILYGKGCVGVVVSVGTARNNALERVESWLFSMKTFTRNAAKKFTDPESGHVSMQKDAEKDKNFSYYRLNQSNGLDMELDQWLPKKNKKNKVSGEVTIRTIEDSFASWASSNETIRTLQDCAEELVARRRKRMSTGKWERYATCAEYECREQGCTEGFFDRNQFKDHFCQKHDLSGDRFERVASGGRTHWRYQPPKAVSATNGRKSPWKH